MNYYTILGCKVDSTPEQIKAQYRKLVALHHPDKNFGSLESENKFKLILEAYEVLSDPITRRKHDIYIQTTPIKDNVDQIKSPKHNLVNFYRLDLLVYVLILIIILFTVKKFTNTTDTSVKNATIKEQNKAERPHTGEIDFTK